MYGQVVILVVERGSNSLLTASILSSSDVRLEIFRESKEGEGGIVV